MFSTPFSAESAAALQGAHSLEPSKDVILAVRPDGMTNMQVEGRMESRLLVAASTFDQSYSILMYTDVDSILNPEPT